MGHGRNNQQRDQDQNRPNEFESSARLVGLAEGLDCETDTQRRHHRFSHRSSRNRLLSSRFGQRGVGRHLVYVELVGGETITRLLVGQPFYAALAGLVNVPAGPPTRPASLSKGAMQVITKPRRIENGFS